MNLCKSLSTLILAMLLTTRVDAAEDSALTRVVVTGSRIATTDAAVTVAPVYVIDRQGIADSGANSVAELLGTLRAVASAGMADNGGDGSFSPGASNAALRGLGPNGTVVLLNSRRLSSYPLADFSNVFTNLDSLPMAAIERVEILRSGGAAIYGSEAIAGVINVITRKDYRGVDLQASGQRSTLSGLFGSYMTSFTAGWGDLQDDKFNVMLHTELMHRDSVVWRDLLSYVNPTYAQRVPSLGSFSTFSYPGNLIGVGPVPGCDPALLIDGLCRYDRYQRFDAVRQADRAYVYSAATLDLGAGRNAFGELLWARTQTRYEHPYQVYGGLAPTTWVNPSNGAINEFSYVGLPATHPLNPTGADGLELRYRFADNPNVDHVRTDQYRLLAGWRAPWWGFATEAAVGVTGGSTDLAQVGAFSASGFRQVIGNWDAPDPQFFGRAYKIGQPNGSDVLNTLFPKFGYAGHTRQTFADLKLEGEVAKLPQGPVRMVLGSDLRHESMSVTPSQRLQQGDMVGYGMAMSDGSRTMGALFGEVSAPLLPGLEAVAALRIDRFSGFSPHASPKVAARYSVTPQWSLRATAETGFRTPNLVESASSAKYAYATVVDTKRCPQAQALAADLQAAAALLPANDPAGTLLLARADMVQTSECSASLTATVRENTGLKPEASSNQTFGLVFAPTADSRFSIDAWHIARRNEIAIDSFADLLAQEGATNSGTLSVVRDRLDSDRSFSAADQTTYGVRYGALRNATTRFRNIGRTRAIGVDLAARTAWNMAGWGRFSAGVNGTYEVDRRVWSDALGGYGDNLAGRAGYPRLNGDLTLGWDYHRMHQALAMHFTDSTSLRSDYWDTTCVSTPALSPAQCQYGADIRWDYSMSYTALKGLTLRAQVQNIFNRRAPDNILVNSVVPPNYSDGQGRMLRVTVQYSSNSGV